MSTAKDEARKIIDTLPDHATWDDIMYGLYVKKKIEAAIQADKEGRVVSHEDVKRRFAPQ